MLGFWDFPSIFGEKYLEQQLYASALYEQASVPMIRTFFSISLAVCVVLVLVQICKFIVRPTAIAAVAITTRRMTAPSRAFLMTKRYVCWYCSGTVVSEDVIVWGVFPG